MVGVAVVRAAAAQEVGEAAKRDSMAPVTAKQTGSGPAVPERSRKQILQLSGQKEQAIALLVQVEKKAEAKDPNFDKLPLPQFHFNLGVELMNMSRVDAAEERFRKVVSDPQSPQREVILSHLRLARLLDWKGRQSEAIKECQIVLSLGDVENSHSQAKQLIRQCNQKLHPS